MKKIIVFIVAAVFVIGFLTINNKEVDYSKYESAKGEEFRNIYLEDIKNINSLDKTIPVRIFIGDSITFQSEVQKINFDEVQNVNLGIPADTSYDALRSLESTFDLFNEFQITEVYILLGTNDWVLYNQNFPSSSTTENIVKITQHISQAKPEAQINVVSVLPTDNTEIDGVLSNETIVKMNEDLKNNLPKNVNFIDVHDLFLGEDGMLSDEYDVDGLHLNSKGYEVLFNALGF